MFSTMAKKPITPKPTESELELLGILWERGPLTVRDLFEAVNAGRPVVYTGVLKLLQIMTDKGLVERDERERAHVYRAAVSQADTEQRFLPRTQRKILRRQRRAAGTPRPADRKSQRRRTRSHSKINREKTITR